MCGAVRETAARVVAHRFGRGGKLDMPLDQKGFAVLVDKPIDLESGINVAGRFTSAKWTTFRRLTAVIRSSDAA